MIPSIPEDQEYLASKIRRLAVFELTKKQMAEDARDIKADIKEKFGKDADIDVAGLVKAAVDEIGYVSKAKEEYEAAQEAVGELSIIKKYLGRATMADEAERYVDGVEANTR